MGLQPHTMDALTLIDDNPKNSTPWASMIECGLKTIETRSWPVPNSGTLTRLPNLQLLICASKSSRTQNAGLAVCVVDIMMCVPYTDEHRERAGCRAVGGYSWLISKLYWLDEKWAVSGRMGLFKVERPLGVNFYQPTQLQLDSKKTELLGRYPALYRQYSAQ